MNLALVFKHAPKRAPKRRLPVAVISQPCAETGCKERFLLPYDAPLGALFELAHHAGWTEHPDPDQPYALLCPQHPHAYPAGESESPPLGWPTAPFQAVTEETS